MIVGIGTDILKTSRLEESLSFDDPFVTKTFTEREIEEAKKRSDSSKYLISRFACKEAVFKCLKINGNNISLREIEVLNSDIGFPTVTLLGNLRKQADERGAAIIEVSLSYEEDYVVAYALAQNNF